jgi:uncharacterized protein YjbI with pentapeptide repeats
MAKGKAKGQAQGNQAQSKPTAESARRLAGKTVALVGKFGYRDMQRDLYTNQVTRAGGKVVDPAKTVPDYLLVGEGRGGKPPADVAKLQKKSPSIEILTLNDLMLTREELLQEISRGRRPDRDRFWDELQYACRHAGTQIDLTGADLRKADLYGANLECADLTGAELRGATTQFTHFGDLKDVNFDECDGEHVYLKNLQNCTFRGANLGDAWFFYYHTGIVENCDFTGARMAGARLTKGTYRDCSFVGGDLSDAHLEETVCERVDFSKADLSRLHAARANLTGATLAKANLSRADLRGSTLVRADLRNANLREAVLSDADLTGANVAGADFQDAVLTGATLKNVDFSKVKNYQPPVARGAGPKLTELAAAAGGAKSFVTKAEVDLGENEFARMELTADAGRVRGRSTYFRDGKDVYDWLTAPTFEEVMIKLAERWPKATLRLDSIEAKGSKTLRGAKLLELAVAAWAETFGVDVPSAEDLHAQRASQQAEAIRERDELVTKVRKEGAEVWQKLNYQLKDRIDLSGVDLSGAKLDKLSMWSRELKGANFAQSSLVEAEFWNGQLPAAVFTGANLENARFENAVLTEANFRDANLTGANLSNAKLLGADFTGAKLKGANLYKAQFDEATVLPKGFAPPDDMVWKGEGPRPGAKKVKAAKAGSLDFESFLTLLNQKVEVERLKKAGSMLKAERFQLFAEVQDDSLVGIVKSQSSADLVYSCRLASTGAFSCCTQNLRPCGGLRGALCKHLLVLIVGLAKAGRLDSATVNHWVDLSRGVRPAIDEEIMSATFLRYKGAEAGEVDWRPTETIPEDFYAM